MDKATAKQILMTGQPADQIAEANAEYYGTGGMYAQDVAKTASLTPPTSPVYAEPPSFTPPPVTVTYVAGLFDTREYMDQLNYAGYIRDINGRNSASYATYVQGYNTWRTNFIAGHMVEPPVPPPFEVPVGYPQYKAWFDQSVTGTSTAPPVSLVAAFLLPAVVPFDYAALVAGVQAVSHPIALGTALKQ